MYVILRFAKSCGAYGLHSSELRLWLAGEEFPYNPNIPGFDSQQQREAAVLEGQENFSDLSNNMCFTSLEKDLILKPCSKCCNMKHDTAH